MSFEEGAAERPLPIASSGMAMPDISPFWSLCPFGSKLPKDRLVCLMPRSVLEAGTLQEALPIPVLYLLTGWQSGGRLGVHFVL